VEAVAERAVVGCESLSERFPNRLVASLLLALLVCATFWPVLRNDFAGYDDNEYVTNNPRVNTGLTPENVKWALTAAHSNNWHPLTWISHQLDCSLFGLAPAGHHAVNLLLHACNTVLLFLWLSGITGSRGRSAFVALIFGLHPLHVESVAWIAERKDVLSAFFGLLTLLAYSAYVRKPGAVRYLTIAALFAAALMSKPMLATLPVLLLLLDWWPLGRRVRVPEKLPLFALAGLSAAVTIWAQRQGGAVASIGQLPAPLRFANAAVSYVRYLGKTIWPSNLAVFYPFPLHGIPAATVAACVAAIAAASALVFALRHRHPWLTLGWCWYLATLLPVIGIVQVGMQSMADRYMYLPMIGLLIAITWECARWRLAAPLVVIACALISWRQIPVWKDGMTLFTHAIAVTQDNFVAHDNLGVELDRRGRSEEAIAQYRETLRIKPGDRIAESNLAQATFDKGERLFHTGKEDEAFASFSESLQLRPRNAMARTYLGLVFLNRQQVPPATAQFRTALDIDPALPRAHVGMGVALAYAGKDVEARRALEQALRLDPTNLEAHFDLGMVLASLGDRSGALRELDTVLKIQPSYPSAREARAALAPR
jgi:Flp pilus assembly protein TadD